MQDQFDLQDFDYENEVNLNLFSGIFEKEEKGFLTPSILDLRDEDWVFSYKQDVFEPKEINLKLHFEEWSPVSKKRTGDWTSALLLGCGGVYIFPAEGKGWIFIQCGEGKTDLKIRELVEETRRGLNKQDESSDVSEALLKHVFLWSSEDKEEILKKVLED
ncbi:hypothetical protein [Candidatus Mycoplasma haematohominis]|uniref:Uncharacterized protein n=1 Tax=Candidatus Mycoplasma haematohominis TaxID=1494318 RepID=A0A478FQH6_9MOLU|nr:hypothetical protein [Candidatus Mycoplasma haemohominis]GCE63174.1 hypothetical protein MHSWG343_01520 [Candidatus Mycoplasma haemohominis]